MLTLPDPRLGTPDLASPWRFLLWHARKMWRTLAAGLALAIVWTLAQALVPWAVGRTIDAGVGARDGGALARWCLLLLALGVTQVGAGVLRHRMAVWQWMQGALRTQQLVGEHTAAHGTAVSAGATTGEVVATVARDAPRIGDLFDVSTRFAAAVVGYAVVAVLLLRVDVLLALFVLLGVPVLSASLAVVVRPLNARQSAQRDAEGELTALGADTVAGLRVLRGIGGEERFAARYAVRSQAVRRAGVRVAPFQASLDSTQVLLPGAFVVLLTWLGARAAVEGRITAGELVTLYGSAAFLAQPLGTASEALGKYVRCMVATRRVLAVLRVRAAHSGGADGPVRPPGGHAAAAGGGVLFDPDSGLHVAAGRLTALVAPVTEEASRLAHRFARLDADLPSAPDAPDRPDGHGGTPAAAPRLDGTPVDLLDVDDLRRRVLVSEAQPRLFTGRLRDEIDPDGAHDDDQVLAALHVADAHDVLDALPEGLDAEVQEQGRSFSGGQRQRLALARALLADPDVLVLVEPTSAVDAHTEARIAERLHTARAGRSTVVTTASPLLLDRADSVALLVGGRVVAQGTHRELLRTTPAYRRTVARDEDDT